MEALWALAVVGGSLAAAGWLVQLLRLPPAIGFVAAGLVFTAVGATDFLPPPTLELAQHGATLLLLFLIGIELDLKRLRECLRDAALVLPLDLLVPMLAAAAIASVWGWSVPEALVLGVAFSISSTLFGERLASTISPDARRRTLGIVLAEDVATAALLLLLVLLGQGAGYVGPAIALGKVALLFVVLAAVGLVVVPRILDALARTHQHDLLLVGALALLVMFAAAGSYAGSAEIGALLAGVAVAEAGSRFVIRNTVGGVRDIAVALFFFAAGLGVHWGDLQPAVPAILLLSTVFLVSKLVVHVPAGIARGLGTLPALQSALSLSTVGEFSLVLAAVAASSGIANPLLGTILVGSILLLMVTSSVLLRAAPTLAKQIDRLPLRRKPGRARRPMDQAAPRGAPVVIINALLLLAWSVAAAATIPLLAAAAPGHPVLVPAALFGVALAVAAPLALATYRHYRRWLNAFVHVRAASERAARVRARIVDAWVAVGAALILLPLGLLVPNAFPVAVVGIVLAGALAAVAWRGLRSFHASLEVSLGRVLGVRAEPVLETILEQYPWGVRFAAVAVPLGSPLAWQSLFGSRLTEMTGAQVAVVHRRREETVNPGPGFVVQPGDTLVLMGTDDEIARAEALVVAHGEALRVTAQSKLARVVEAVVAADAPILGKTLGELAIRNQTGAMVVGLWPAGAEHPEAFRPDARIAAGDKLILLGSGLQLDRARKLAQGEPPPQSD